MQISYASSDHTSVGVESHTTAIDQRLGFRIADIEQDLYERAHGLDPAGNMQTWGRQMHGGSQTWVGLESHALLTPYDELNRMCQQLAIGENGHIVDLGAGYGRMAFVLNHYQPSAYFTGVELVPERVSEGNRLFGKYGLRRAQLVEDNLFRPDFTLPLADAYLIYDYGNIEHIRWTMGQLQHLAGVHRFKVIARGKGVRTLIQYAHPWLTVLGVPYHEENFSIYSTYDDGLH